MNPRRFLFCGYSAVVILVPVNPHPYTFLVNSLVWLINVFCHHFFRVFLSSGTPASKTIFHSLLWSLSVCYQLHLSVIALYVLLGNLFNASIEEFVSSHPVAACVLFTPRWTSNPLTLYLFYLATLKLIIALKPYSLMQINQERAAFFLNISVVVLSLVDTGAALLFNGSTCDAVSATLFLKITTGLAFGENTLGSSSSAVYILALLTIIMLTVVEYTAADIIVNLSSYKAWFVRYRARMSNHNNEIREDSNRDNDNVFIVLPPESYGQSGANTIPNINNVANPQPLTQFQKMLNLIKGMGFFTGFFFLMVCIFLIFFEIGFIIRLIINIGGKLLIQCTPMYWVLVVDDVYELTKRRVAQVLARVYHYFTEGKENQQYIKRLRRDTLSRVGDDILPIPGSSTRDLGVAGTIRYVLPVAGFSQAALREADKRPIYVLPNAGLSTTDLRVPDKGQRVLLQDAEPSASTSTE